MRTYAIINQKGGCGKTTTAINLAGILARRGCRSLLVDLDPQSHCAAGLAIPDDRIDVDIGDAMTSVVSGDRCDASRLIWRISRNLDLAPSRMSLAGLEAGRGALAQAPDREHCLSRVLRRLDEHARATREAAEGASSAPDSPGYDLVCIDCPPSIGLLTYNAIVASSEILVPVESSFFSLQGATKQVQTIKALGRKLGVTPTVRLVATLHDESSALARDIYGELQRRFGDSVLPFVIRFDHAIREAASFGRPVVEYAPKSAGAEDYNKLADWLMTREGVRASDLPVEEFDPGVSPRVTPLDRLNERARLAAAGDPTGGPAVVAGSERSARGTGAPPSSSPTLEPEPSVVVTGSVSVTDLRSGPPTDASGAAIPTESHAGALARSEDAGDRARDVVRRAQRLQRQTMLGGAVAPGTGMQPNLQPDQQPDLDAGRHASTEPSAPADPGATAAVHLVKGAGPEVPTRTLVAPTADPVAEPPMVSVRRLFGVRSTARGVLFVQPLSIGRTVSIAGSFNDWTPGTHRMRANQLMGVYELILPLEDGRHEYRLVIDGSWIADSYNTDRCRNEYGEENCVLYVGRVPGAIRTPSVSA